MNIKAIIASLVLAASSSAAMAAPSVTVTATAQGSYDTTVVRDHRLPPVYHAPAPIVTQPASFPGYRRPPVFRTVTLASGLSFANQGRAFITVGSQAGRFEKLQLSAAGGSTLIKQVYVQFDNGQEQIVRNLNRTLSGNESLTLDLDGNRRAIRRIVVYGNGNTVGWYRSAGTFTVTAA
jgi:hypothetical protein